MNDIKQKALALLNDVRTERGFAPVGELHGSVLLSEALCRTIEQIEQHEAFRKEVSDAVELSIDRSGHDGLRAGHINEYLGRFIIPAPKLDLLVEVIGEIEDGTWGETKVEYAERIRAALKARGLEIREKGQ